MIVYLDRHCVLQDAGWIIRIVVKKRYIAKVRMLVGARVVVVMPMLGYQ